MYYLLANRACQNQKVLMVISHQSITKIFPSLLIITYIPAYLYCLRYKSVLNFTIHFIFISIWQGTAKEPSISEINIFQTNEFLKTKVRDRGQIPTKLKYRENKNYKPIVITQVSRMSIDTISPFFNTLNCTGYNGDLLIFYSHLAQEVKQYINSFKDDFRKIITIEVTSRIPYLVNRSLLNSFQYNCDYCKLNFVSCDERFDIIYCLYKNHFFDEYNFILITDSRDVIFQTDFTQYNYDEGVYVAEEARIAVLDNMYWTNMVKSSALPKVQRNWTDLCVGTLILVGEGISFLEDLHKQMKILEPNVYQRPNFQGNLIILIYNNTFNYKPGYIHFIPCEHGIIESFGRYYFHLNEYKRMNMKIRGNYSIFTVQLHDNNYLFYNSDFQLYSILHHVNRFKDIYRLTYSYLQKTCRVRKRFL